MSAPDTRQLVQALPAEDLYLALLDVGPDDAAEVVALATPEQFRHFIDMAAWRGGDEGPRAAEVLRWLRLAREGGHGASSADARFGRQLAALDVELLALVLRRELRVHDLGEEEEPELEEPGHAFYTPERRFLLEFSGSAEFSALRRLVDDLYAQDPFAAGRLIESVRWEVPTELEESARRWRDGRLRDAGVPDFEEAVAFYARPAARRGGEQRSPAPSEEVNSVHQR